MISKIAMIIFFLLYGINHFAAIPAIGAILAVTAIIIAVALIANQ